MKNIFITTVVATIIATSAVTTASAFDIAIGNRAGGGLSQSQIAWIAAQPSQRTTPTPAPEPAAAPTVAEATAADTTRTEAQNIAANTVNIAANTRDTNQNGNDIGLNYNEIQSIDEIVSGRVVSGVQNPDGSITAGRVDVELSLVGQVALQNQRSDAHGTLLSGIIDTLDGGVETGVTIQIENADGTVSTYQQVTTGVVDRVTTLEARTATIDETTAATNENTISSVAQAESIETNTNAIVVQRSASNGNYADIQQLRVDTDEGFIYHAELASDGVAVIRRALEDADAALDTAIALGDTKSIAATATLKVAVEAQLAEAQRAITAVTARASTNRITIDSYRTSIDQNSSAISANRAGVMNNSLAIKSESAKTAATVNALVSAPENGIGVGIGANDGEHAISIGYRSRITEKTTLSLSVSAASNSSPTFGIGFGWKF